MAQTGNQELTDRFIQFYRNYYRDEVGRLAQEYPNERRSLYVDYNDLFTFDRDLAEDFLVKPELMQEYAEEALRLYDLPADVSLGQAHVRLRNLPPEQDIEIDEIRVQDDHIGQLVSVHGVIRRATDVRPKITEAAFECQRCGTMSYIPQIDSGFNEPHECQGCERQGPFSVNHDQSEFVDSQTIWVEQAVGSLEEQHSRQQLEVDLEDDITGVATAGDQVTITGVLHIEQVGSGSENTPYFETYLEATAVEKADQYFDDIEISEAEINEIQELAAQPDIFDQLVASLAPSIEGLETEKLALVLQAFGGVPKELPEGGRVRGNSHTLLIGDPGTGRTRLLRATASISPRSTVSNSSETSAVGRSKPSQWG